MQAFSVPELTWSPVLGLHGLVYSRASSEGEWDYPWDLCGSIYRATGELIGLLHCYQLAASSIAGW